MRACLLFLTLLLGPLAARGEQRVRMLTLDAAGKASSRRLVAGLVRERELAIGGARSLVAGGQVPRALVASMSAAYDRMQAAVGEVPTPAVATGLGLQRPEAFDLVLVEPTPSSCRNRRTAVVFLHGYAGNFTLPCWLVARAGQRRGLVTACPSVGREGDWWSARGARTLRATLRYLRGRGYSRFVLAGLSNGGTGASTLAPRYARQLAGLVLISGASRRARPPRGKPVLLVHGRGDTMFSPAFSRRYARRAGRRATLALVEGGHFVLVTCRARVTRILEAWLERRVSACAGGGV